MAGFDEVEEEDDEAEEELLELLELEELLEIAEELDAVDDELAAVELTAVLELAGLELLAIVCPQESSDNSAAAVRMKSNLFLTMIRALFCD